MLGARFRLARREPSTAPEVRGPREPTGVGGDAAPSRSRSLLVVAREWTRIGVTGFGGPPAHIALLRELVVGKYRWMDPREFEDANAACGLLPGPASTQMAILCAYRTAGVPGALVGGLGFIIPAVILIIALSLLFLGSSPPRWVRAAGAGAGAAVPAVAVHAGRALMGPSIARVRDHRERVARWLLYLFAGVAGAVLIGPYLVLALLGAGLAEMAAQRVLPRLGGGQALSVSLLFPAAISAGGIGSLLWVALKVGALSFGGGFVIIPLMQGDAVHVYHWMSNQQFLSAVALGQVTPGPVVSTVAAVGYAARGLLGAVLAALVAFAPSFAFILLGARRFGRLQGNERARAFLDGAGPAAIGAILGAAVVLAAGLDEAWQFAVLGAALAALLALKRGVVSVLVAAGVIGVVLGLTGAPVPP